MFNAEIIDAELEPEKPGNPAFARVFAAFENLDALLEDPDAAGTPQKALDAMRHQAATLSRELQAATVTDLDEEYDDSDEGEDDD